MNEQTTPTLICPHCEALISPDSRFCKVCGATVATFVATRSASGRMGDAAEQRESATAFRADAENADNADGLDELLHRTPELKPEDDHQKRIRVKKVRRRHGIHLFHLSRHETGRLIRSVLVKVAIVILALLIAYMLLRYLERTAVPPQIIQ